MYLKLIGLALTVTLTACGSDSDTSSGTSTLTESKNVALSTNGGTIESVTYDDTSAAKTIDGDTTTSEYWAGNVDGDNFIIDFGQEAELSNITIYTNTTSYSSSDPAIQASVSTDQQTWKSTLVPFGSVDISCPTWSAGSGKLICGISSAEIARYIRITTNSSAVSIYEVEVTGTVPVE